MADVCDTLENGGEVYKICPKCEKYHQDHSDICNKCSEEIYNENAKDWYVTGHSK